MADRISGLPDDLEERSKIDIELKHQGVNRPETKKEQSLKKTRYQLQKEVDALDTSNVYKEIGLDIIRCKERELKSLIHKLNDEFHFEQKAIDKPKS